MTCRSRFIDDPNLSVAERDAQRQVLGLRRFYLHLLAFLVVGSGLVVVNLLIVPARS